MTEPEPTAKAADEKGQEGEERFRLMVESVVDYAIFMLDPHGVILTWNAGAERIKGYRADEIVGQHFSRLYLEEDVRAGVCDRVLEQAALGGRFECEGWRRRKDGWVFWASVVITALRSPNDGALLGFCKVTRDTTERRLAEDSLRESEERFRLTLDEAPIGMAFAALDGRFMSVNRALCELVGYSADELTALTFQEITHPDDFEEHLALAGRLTRGDISRGQLATRYIRKGGAIIDVMLSVSILRNRGGAPLHYIAQIEDITERKRAERALRDSEQLLSLALDASGQGLWDWNVATDEAHLSPRYLELIGYAEGEQHLDLEFFLSHMHPKDRPAVEKAVQEHLQGKSALSAVEYRARKKSGEYVWLNAIGRVTARDQNGVPLRMVGVLLDISERKRIEEELRAANISFDAIIENIPIMLFVKEGKSLRFLRFNRACEELLGWPRQSFVGKNDYDFWPQAQADFFVEKDRETLRIGKTVEVAEEPIQTRDRGIRLLHTKKVPVLDEAGNPIYLLGISEDITERKRVEKEQQFLGEAGAALAASLDYEQTLATLARLVVQNVADWCVVEVIGPNAELRRLLVVCSDPTQAALAGALERMPPDRALPHFVGALAEGREAIVVEHVTHEYLESWAQGPEHLNLLLATGLTSLLAVPLLKRGELLGVLMFGSSTPSHVYGNGDLRWAEALADQAAAAIENARLYRASLQAAHLRDEVLGVVAHDLRNPLNTILLQAAGLDKGRGEADKPSGVIRRAAGRMNRLIQDLLDVARADSGTLPIQRARLSAAELIVEAVDTQRPLASSSSLELRLDLEREVPAVSGDRDRLLQVFENLIGNAMKFTRPGGLITVGAAPRQHEVVFWVADTGCGIAPDSLPHVFDRFWQGARDGEGAGLGLLITKGIVEAHGGGIWVDSTMGEGSTFFFTIPEAAPPG